MIGGVTMETDSHDKKSKLHEKYERKLEKEESKLEKYNGREQQLQLNFSQQSQPDGRLHTSVQIIRGEKDERYDTKGMVHRLVNQKYRLVGNVPKIENYTPTSTTGKIAKVTATAGKYALKGTAAAAMAVETAGMHVSAYRRKVDIRKQEQILGKNNRYEDSGVLHKAINRTYRLTGTDFSVKRKLQNYQPTSLSGKALKAAVSTGYTVAKTAVFVGMAAEMKLTGGNEQFQLKFTRQQDNNGKFKTKVHVVRAERAYQIKNKGILHRVINQKYRLVGDVPSLSKTVDTAFSKWKPSTIKGMTAKSLLQVGTYTVKGTAKAALKTALALDTGAAAVTDMAKKKAAYEMKQGLYKYKQEATDDMNKAVLEDAKIVKDAALGTRSHFQKKKQHKLHKARYRLQKYSLEDVKPQSKKKLKQNKRDIKAKKSEIRIQKLQFKREKTSGNPTDKAVFRSDKKDLKLEKKELKNKRKQTKSELKASVKNVKNLKKLSFLSALTTPLALRPAKYATKRVMASGYQKAINADPSNDFIKVADFAKRQVVDKAASQIKPTKLLEKTQKKNNKLQDKRGKRNAKLKKQESRLKTKRKKNTAKKSQPKKPKQSLAKKLKKFIKNIYEKEAKWFLGTMLFPILIIALVFALIISIFASIFTQSGFTLGTFTAQDYDLSQAEEYYTKLGYDLNSTICSLKDENNNLSSSWKKILKNLGADTSGMKDKPSEWYWGRSNELNYDPVWDFDPWMLWSFLCAYYYDFSSDSNANNNSDIKFWKFNSNIEDLLEELFEDEYQFEYRYYNGSRWEERWDYNFATGDGSRFRCLANNLSWDNSGNVIGIIELENNIGSLATFTQTQTYPDGRTTWLICYSLNNLEILNSNNNYAATGWYVMDEGATISSASGNTRHGLYQWNGGSWGYTDVTGTWHDRDDGWFGWYMPGTGVELKNTPIATIAPVDGTNMGFPLSTQGLYTFYQKYDWVTDCQLYYNVKQKKTFEQVILDKLGGTSYSSERIEYYNLLVGKDASTQPLYGNHQTYKNIFAGDTFKSYMHDGNILNWFGYDMQGWLYQHCDIATYEYTENPGAITAKKYVGLHHGIDVSYPANASIYSPLDCTIDKYDAGEHVVVLRQNGVYYWYDGKAGNGKNRDTKIYITNVTLKSGYSEGSSLKAGEEFAITTGDRKCICGNKTGADDTIQSGLPYDYIHVAAYIDTDGVGWNYVDPILLFY